MKDRVLIQWIAGGIFALQATIGALGVAIYTKVSDMSSQQAVNTEKIKDMVPANQLVTKDEFNSHLIDMAEKRKDD